MINEIYTGNRFRGLINRHLPFGWGHMYEYTHKKCQIPDVLDYSVQEFGGVALSYKGPRDDVEIIYSTPEADVPLKVLAPVGTRFSIYDSSWPRIGYVIQSDSMKIPSDFPGSRINRRMINLYAVAYFWSLQDQEFAVTYSNAEKLLTDRSRWIFSPQYYDEHKQWEQQEIAKKVIGQAAKRAEVGSLYIAGRLKRAGINILAGLTVAKLKRIANENNWIYEKDDSETHFDFRLSNGEVKAALAGELPFPRIKEIIDAHLDQVIANNVINIKTPLVQRSASLPMKMLGILGNIAVLPETFRKKNRAIVWSGIEEYHLDLNSEAEQPQKLEPEVEYKSAKLKQLQDLPKPEQAQTSLWDSVKKILEEKGIDNL